MPRTATSTVLLPDLLSMCPWPLHINPLEPLVSPATDRWIECQSSHAANFSKTVARQAGLKTGLFASMSWPDLADLERLQVCADFVTYLFHMDDLTDEMEIKDAKSIRDAIMGPILDSAAWKTKIERGEARSVSILIHDLWTRIARDAYPLVRARFARSFDAFFSAVIEEAKLRKAHITPTLAEYEPRRRANSAMRCTYAMVEYSCDMELPEEIWNNPVVRDLEDWANDMGSWANDILSFGVEYPRGDTYNLVIVIMAEKHLSIQEAMDYSGELFRARVAEFLHAKSALPSWGPEIDRAVRLYVKGLEDWVIGTVEWCFWTTRYFKDEGMKVKETRIMEFEHPQPLVGSAMA